MSLVCCFFFQAEDGIRDADVTGVQTCALPILKYQCSRSWNRASFGPPRVMSTAVHCPGRPRKTRGPVYPGSSCHRISKILMRSEERRVGKECRSRWWRVQKKKRKKAYEAERVF